MSETRVRITVDGRPHEALIVRGEDGSLEVHIDGEVVPIHARENATGSRALRIQTGDTWHNVRRLDLHRVRIDDAVSTFTIEHVQTGQAGAEVPTTGLDVRPPMPGRIVRLDVQEGDVVEQGGAIGVLEAMKMQNELTSPAHGTVRQILVDEGDTVDAQQVILRLGPVEEEPSAEKKKVVA